MENQPIIEERKLNEKNIQKDEEEDYTEIDKKLSDLMLKGWIMLAETCPLETCRCPLMKSPDGQKYCCNCESWIFDAKKRIKKKFNELVPIKNRPLQVNHTEVAKIKKPENDNVNLLSTLNAKLNYLTTRLINERDVHLIEIILKDINLTLDAIAKLKSC